VRAAGNAHPALQGIGYITLGTLAAESGDFNTGLKHAWTAYDLIRGNVTIHRHAALTNIAQMLLDAGYPAAARAGFARLLEDSLEVHALYPVIGGYAAASAALSDRSGVQWATTEVLRLAKRRGHPDALASALFECSEALADVDEQTRAGTLRRRALRLAEQHGLHQLSFKALRPTMAVVPSTPRLTRAAAAIANRVTEMEPDRTPPTVVYAD
jgi:hypothetical protein